MTGHGHERWEPAASEPDLKRAAARCNWEALKRLTDAYLRQVRLQQPDWSIEQLLTSHDLTPTALLWKLAQRAGFPEATKRTERTTEGPLDTVWAQVSWQEHRIAAELSISRDVARDLITQARQVIDQSLLTGPLPPSRRSIESFTFRHVTRVGQLSYRGRLYTLGALYRNQMALLRELDETIVLLFIDRPALRLCVKRHTANETAGGTTVAPRPPGSDSTEIKGESGTRIRSASASDPS